MLTGILVIIALWVIGVITIPIGVVLLFAKMGKPKPAKPAPVPAPKPAAPEPAPEPPMPDYIPRWNRARVLREWQDLARFQQMLND